MTAPVFSILTPVYDPPVRTLQAAIDSVRAQHLGSWELVLVDDCSPNEDVRRVLREAATADRRIVVHERAVNGGIVAASNDALERAAGEFVALLDHDDVLTADALEVVADHINSHPDVDYLYSDEDKIDQSERIFDTFEKPEWSPERLRGQMYTSHLSVLRTQLAREVGGFAVGSDGSQDHDLVLRVTERARRVVHIPRTLYHWRVVEGSTAHAIDAKPYAWVAGRDAVQNHLDRVGIAGTVDFGPVPGTYSIHRSLSPSAKVSIVIPTRGSRGFVWGESRNLVVECVRSIIDRGTHANVEIVVVYDLTTPPEALEDLRAIAEGRLVLVPFEEPFNFSAKCNVGYLASTGSAVLFMNDDMQVISPRFVEDLVAPLAEDDVGATGARLLFPDTRLQHGGHVYADGNLTHAGLGVCADDPGPFSSYVVNRECSGLTGACIAVTRETFEHVGGFCEALPGNFNDVDFSMKVRTLRGRLLWIANASLYHFESLTRDSTVKEWEYDVIMHRWGTPERDPFFPVDFA